MDLRPLALTFKFIQHPKTEAILTAHFTSPRTPQMCYKNFVHVWVLWNAGMALETLLHLCQVPPGPMKRTTIHTECSNEP